jgi:pilus assembly protein Flp/PilA
MRSTTFFIPRRHGAVLRSWWGDEEGVTSIEYGLVAALIVIVCIGAFTAYADALAALYVLWTDAVIAALS